MTVTSTVVGIVMIPFILLLYASALDLEIPTDRFVATLVVTGLARVAYALDPDFLEVIIRDAAYKGHYDV